MFLNGTFSITRCSFPPTTRTESTRQGRHMAKEAEEVQQATPSHPGSSMQPTGLRGFHVLIRSSHAAACQQELFFSLNYTKYIGQILYLRISMLVKNWRSFVQTQTGFGGQNRERDRLIDGCNATSGTYQRSQKPDLYALPAQILCDRSHGPSAM